MHDTPEITPPKDIMVFWELYQKHYDELAEAHLNRISAENAFAPILAAQSPEERARESAESRERMRVAIEDGDWGPYMVSLSQQGQIYASLGVGFDAWVDLCGLFLRVLAPHAIADYRDEPEKAAAAISGASWLVDLAIVTIGEDYLASREQVIQMQSDEIRELSTPVLIVQKGLLLVPLVGVIDSHRARHLMERALDAITEHRARAMVIDITGVAAVDSKVAHHILQTVAAARLMGTKVVVTGVSSSVAQALVALEVQVGELFTTSNLATGLTAARQALGLRGEVK